MIYLTENDKLIIVIKNFYNKYYKLQELGVNHIYDYSY